MKRFLFGLTVVLFVGVIAVPAVAAPQAGGAQRWQVTVENLTPTGSQPLSPPLVVVHSSRADVWNVGTVANHGVAAIAEDANNASLEEALPQVPGVETVFTVPGGPIPPGDSRSFELGTRGRFERMSLLTMLVNTNDAFTGLDSLGVHGKGAVIDAIAYDAGSERNNELAAFIPGPCCKQPVRARPRRLPDPAPRRHYRGRRPRPGRLRLARARGPDHHHPRPVAARVPGRSQSQLPRPQEWHQDRPG